MLTLNVSGIGLFRFNTAGILWVDHSYHKLSALWETNALFTHVVLVLTFFYDVDVLILRFRFSLVLCNVREALFDTSRMLWFVMPMVSPILALECGAFQSMNRFCLPWIAPTRGASC